MAGILFLDADDFANAKDNGKIGYFISSKNTKLSGSIKPSELSKLLESLGPDYIAGHNIIEHDVQKLKKHNHLPADFDKYTLIDTLWLSRLFLKDAYHALNKDYKDENTLDDPEIDANNSQKLFEEIQKAFEGINHEAKSLLFVLLKDDERFNGFFKLWGVKAARLDLVIAKISELCLDENYCKRLEEEDLNKNFTRIIRHINKDGTYRYEDKVEKMALFFAFVLAAKVQNKGLPKFLSYCDALEIFKKRVNLNALIHKLSDKIKQEKGGRLFFNFREFKGFKDKKKMQFSQKDLIEKDLAGKSLLCILPTAGGKSLCYQLPALINSTYNALRLVIAPLIALIKDQASKIKEDLPLLCVGVKAGRMHFVQKEYLLKRLARFEFDILYIAPESLKGLIPHLRGQYIERIVIDEAHYIEEQDDFRVAYKALPSLIKALGGDIPISFFSATNMDEEALKLAFSLDKLSVFKSLAKREELSKKIIKISLKKEDFHEEAKLDYKKFSKELFRLKFEKLQALIKDLKKPILVYAHNKKDCKEIAKGLGDEAGAYYNGAQDGDENLARFEKNELAILVVTSKLSVGFNKKNIRSLIHFKLPPTKAIYDQECGRAGRDAKAAICLAFYHENDFYSYVSAYNDEKLEELNEYAKILYKYIKEKLDKENEFIISAQELVAKYYESKEQKYSKDKKYSNDQENAKFVRNKAKYTNDLSRVLEFFKNEDIFKIKEQKEVIANERDTLISDEIKEKIGINSQIYENSLRDNLYKYINSLENAAKNCFEKWAINIKDPKSRPKWSFKLVGFGGILEESIFEKEDLELILLEHKLHSGYFNPKTSKYVSFNSSVENIANDCGSCPKAIKKRLKELQGEKKLRVVEEGILSLLVKEVIPELNILFPESFIDKGELLSQQYKESKAKWGVKDDDYKLLKFLNDLHDKGVIELINSLYIYSYTYNIKKGKNEDLPCMDKSIFDAKKELIEDFKLECEGV